MQPFRAIIVWGTLPRTSVCRPWVISVSMSSGTDTSQRSSRRSTEQPIDRRYRSVNCSTTDCVTEIEASVIALTKIKPSNTPLLNFSSLPASSRCSWRSTAIVSKSFSRSISESAATNRSKISSSKLVPDSSKRLRIELSSPTLCWKRSILWYKRFPVRTPRPYLSTPY